MRKVIAILFVLCGMGFAALPPCTKPIESIDTALVPKVIYVDQNDDEAYDCINEQGDTLRALLTALGGTTSSPGLSSTGDIKANIDRDSNTTGSRFWVANHTNDTLFRVSDDLAIKAYGAFTVVGASTLAALAAATGDFSSTLSVTGAVSFPSLTASLPLALNASKQVINGAVTGTGTTQVLSISPSITGTLAGASSTWSGTLGVTGETTLSGRLTFAAPSTAVDGAIWKGLGAGLSFRGVTGSSYDMAFFSASVGSYIMRNPTGGTAIEFPGTAVSVAGTLGVTGIQSNAEAIAFTANGTGGNGRIYKSSGGGLTMRAVTGSLYDFTVESADGNNIIGNPTGTRGIVFPAAAGVTITALAGTGTRVTTSTSTGVQGNATTIAGANTWSDAQTFTAASVHSAGIASAGNIAVSKSTAAALAQIAAVQTDNTSASSHAILAMSTGGGSSGDPKVLFEILGATDWAMGVDNSDGDAFVIKPSIFLNGTGNAVKITTGGAVTIPGTLALGGNEPIDYDESSFTATLTGCTTSPTVTATYVKVGKMISLMIPVVNATSNTTALSFTGLPAAIQPATSRAVPIQNILNNSTELTVVTYASIGPSGTISISITNGGSFTASGSKGLNQSVQLSYSLN